MSGSPHVVHIYNTLSTLAALAGVVAGASPRTGDGARVGDGAVPHPCNLCMQTNTVIIVP